MASIDADDLTTDPVVRFQHKFFVPLAIIMGIAVPVAIASVWDDAIGGFVWGALVARIIVWHSTFIVNSLAHWHGLQQYSDEMSDRGNWLFALLTGGEGNHNFHHTFPYDYRATPAYIAWDPSKWIILFLGKLGVVSKIRRASSADINFAQQRMRLQSSDHHGPGIESEAQWNGPCWTVGELKSHLSENPNCCLLFIDGFILDISPYIVCHPGGAKLLMRYCIKLSQTDDIALYNATKAFHGGFNVHSGIAKLTMKKMRIALFISA